MPGDIRITNQPKEIDDMNATSEIGAGAGKVGYNRFLLLVAGLGGLLYGIDVGIIAGALLDLKPRQTM